MTSTFSHQQVLLDETGYSPASEQLDLLPEMRVAPRPTMRDVALAAGVSLKTVSRVINREVGVRPQVFEKVSEAVTALGYVPDERARNLRRSDALPSSIGFAMGDVANPFFSAILRGLEEVARHHNCLVLSASSDHDPERENQLVDIFIQRRVAGIVLVPSSDNFSKMIPSLLRGTPVVFLDCEGDPQTCDIVRSDHYGGSAKLTEHLIERGHRDISFIGDSIDIYSARLRFEGYREVMARHGLPTKEDWIINQSLSPTQWQDQLRQWFVDNGVNRTSVLPTAIVSAQNFATVGAVKALHELGLQRKIALVGFDDIAMGDVVEPGITVYPQLPLELGRQAGDILFRRLNGSQEPLVRDVLSSELIVRGSGEIRPAS